jgi:hypothetical protein
MSDFWDWFLGTKRGVQNAAQNKYSATNVLTSNVFTGRSPLSPPGPRQDNIPASDIYSGSPGGQIGSRTGIPKPNSLADILAELQRLQNPDRYSVDPALLDRQAMAQVSAQYDPITAALRGQGSAAEARAQRNKQQLGSMYEGLSQNLMGDIAPIQQQYAATEQKTQQQYADLQNQIKDQYASSQGEQEAMMKRLNIEAAAPQALEGQQSDRNFAVSQAAQQGQNVQDQLTQQGAGATTYTRQGSELARTEGTNRQADLMAALSDYMNQVNSQIGANEAAKSSAYQSTRLGLQQDSSKSAIENAQRDLENYMKIFGFMKGMEPAQQQIGPVKSPLDVGPRVMGTLGLDANSAQQVQNAFMTAISSDPLIMAGADPTSGMALTKEALANRVVEAGRARGLSGSALNALQNVALEYFGRQ